MGTFTPAHGAHLRGSRCIPPLKPPAQSLVVIDHVAAAAGASIATLSRIHKQTMANFSTLLDSLQPRATNVTVVRTIAGLIGDSVKPRVQL